jgi:uncharacterized protein YodC (DUF2158 family)
MRLSKETIVAQKYKIGDIVELNSGGPRMTVSQLGSPIDEVSRVQCQWFAGSKQQEAWFPEDSLNPASADGKK